METAAIQPLLNAGGILAIINVRITNQQKFMEYVVGHLPSLEHYGGAIIFESHAFT